MDFDWSVVWQALPELLKGARLTVLMKTLGAEADRLTEDLEVRVSGSAPDFSWAPPVSFDEGIRSLADGG